MKESDGYDLLLEVNKILEFGEKGLAKIRETESVKTRIASFLSNQLDNDSTLGRELDRWLSGPTWYYDVHGTGFANESYLIPLRTLRTFLTRYLDEANIKPKTTQKYLKTGDVFTGRTILRNMFSEAKNKIFVQDSYLDHTVLQILEPIFEVNPKIEARLLTTHPKPSLKQDLPLFLTQFGRVEAKTFDKAHGRFVIIDDTEVYSLGSSILDYGKKADVITKILDPESTKMMKDFKDWWDNGSDL